MKYGIYGSIPMAAGSRLVIEGWVSSRDPGEVEPRAIVRDTPAELAPVLANVQQNCVRGAFCVSRFPVGDLLD